MVVLMMMYLVYLTLGQTQGLTHFAHQRILVRLLLADTRQLEAVPAPTQLARRRRGGRGTLTLKVTVLLRKAVKRPEMTE
jgi:hypothetical protein